MKISGKVHCFFEQSGTFKNEFKKLGIPAEDYDIQNNFGQTDHVIDLFAEIEQAYVGSKSIFDGITKDDLIVAFFPCIHFCDAKVMMFKHNSNFMKNCSLAKRTQKTIDAEAKRHVFFTTLIKMVNVCAKKDLRIIIENPWNNSGMTYLQNNFPDPTIIDKNRANRGDYFIKPTAYWYFGCEPTHGCTIQKNPNPKIVYNQHGAKQVVGQCDEQRSMISPDYARNFICDFVIGKEQRTAQLKINFEKYE